MADFTPSQLTPAAPAYTSVAKRVERAEMVKGSSFLALVAPVSSLAEVEALLAEVRERHPDASHCCFAYKLGGLVRFSDDGEPGGTAGRPMLEVLDKRGLDHVLGVVTRYFGGTRLGAGGLARAYGGSLAKCLDEAGTRPVYATVTLRLSVPFADTDAVHRLLDGWPDLVKGEPAYSSSGLELGVTLLAHDEGGLTARLGAVTRGRGMWSRDAS